MVDSPIIILFELVSGLIDNFFQTFRFIYMKLVELFVALAFIAGISPIGMVIAVLIGSVVLFFIIKMSFGSSKTLIVLFLFFFMLMLLIMLGVGSYSVA